MTVSAHATVATILPAGSARGTGVLHHSSPTRPQTLRLERLGEYGNPEPKGRIARAAGAEDMLFSVDGWKGSTRSLCKTLKVLSGFSRTRDQHTEISRVNTR